MKKGFRLVGLRPFLSQMVDMARHPRSESSVRIRDEPQHRVRSSRKASGRSDLGQVCVISTNRPRSNLGSGVLHNTSGHNGALKYDPNYVLSLLDAYTMSWFFEPKTFTYSFLAYSDISLSVKNCSLVGTISSQERLLTIN